MDEERVRILLVEDDPDDVYVMRNLLGDRWQGPFELVNVELLSAAIQRCQDERFDVVLLDLGLPDSNGLETFFSIYAHAGDVPIVVLTGTATNERQSRPCKPAPRIIWSKGN
jgi:CheY-like chemotaxis protein